MARKWLIAIAVIALIIGGIFLIGFLIPDSGNATDMEIIFYDVDGNELGRSNTELSILGIQSPGFAGDIYSLDVVVYFQVTTNIDYTAIATACYLTIETRLNTMTSGIVHTIAEHRLGAINSDESGTFYANYLMSTLLPDSKIESSGKENGWMMYFNARVHTGVSSVGNPIIDVEDTCGTTLALTWDADRLELESWFGDW